MKIFNLAAFTALLAIAYSKGSEAKETNQLIGKAGNDNQLELKNALVCIMFIGDGKCIGGGALLSSTTVIVPMKIFIDYYGGFYYKADYFNAVIGVDLLDISRSDCFHRVIEIIEGMDPNCLMESALALVIIEHTSLAGNSHPSWVPHIPLATQSYTEGEHTVSESVVVWNMPGGLEKHPIRNVIVDDEGTIFTSIPAPSDGNQVVCFPNYHGGFITRGGTLAGLAVNYERQINGGVLIEFTFLPVDGNNPLIKNGRDNDIQIKDIDSAGRSSKRRRTNEGPSNMDIFIK